MGKYINIIGKRTLGPTFKDKLAVLIEEGADTMVTPLEWEEGLVCLVDNGAFAAAGYAYNEKEMNIFIDGMGGRPHIWLKYDDAKKYAS